MHAETCQMVAKRVGRVDLIDRSRASFCYRERVPAVELPAADDLLHLLLDSQAAIV